MVVEERCYWIQPGRLSDLLQLYTDGPAELQRRIQGNLLGYFTTDIGEQSQIVNLWGYSSLDDRAERRARLALEPQWQEYLKKCTPLILRMQNRILIPTSFSPIN